MSTGATALALIGLALGAVVLALVLVLLRRVLRPLREIERYAGHTLAGGLGICRNLDGVDAAVATRDLAVALPPLALRYLERLRGPAS